MKNLQKAMTGVRVLLLGLAVLGLAACSPDAETEKWERMTPGTYVQEAQGFAAPYTVWVTVSETQITNITWDGLADSAGLGAEAVPHLKTRILEAQTTGVDSISGATATSIGFKAAVTAALEEAGASVAFTGKPRDPARRVDKTVNAGVLVIGSGIAGLSAAVQAKTDRNDATVIVIEKQDIIGGTTKTSAGVVYAAMDDTPDKANELTEYYMMRAQGYADRELVQFFAENSYETLSFLNIFPGVGMPTGTAEEERCRFGPGGNGIVQYLYGEAINKGVIVMTGVKGTELIVDKTTGMVTGVKAESKTINFTFNVSGGVVIATGGFDSDHEGLMKEYNPDSAGDIPQSNWGNVGDGIKMGMAIGADTVFKGGKIGWVGVSPGLTASHYYSAVIKEDGELLSLTPPAGGETVNGHTLAAVTYATHPDDYAVVHKRMLDARAEADGTMTFWALANTPPDPGHESRGLAYTSNTIAGLATLIKADTDKLTKSFNSRPAGEEARAEGGEFGATLTTTGTVFTATRAVPSSIGSMGGLKINKKAEVLKGGSPIPHLYAAGETANGDLFYLEYPASGSSLATGATFGREAGKNAAANVPQQPAWPF